MSYIRSILLCLAVASLAASLTACATNDYFGPAEDAGNDEDAEAPQNNLPPDNNQTIETCIDRDSDGYGDGCALGPDCVDLDNAVHPGANEICDGKDNDCSGLADDGIDCGSDCVDNDQDGRGPNCALGLDCDDDDPDRFPDNVEVCDGKDNNCDGNADEIFVELGTSCMSGLGACARQGTIVCGADQDSECSATPGNPTTETCNDIDDDCNGMVDDGLNCDSCTEDSFEPNDSSGTGTPLAAGQSRSAVRCPDDQGGSVDWYSLGTLSAGTTLTLNLEFSHADGNLDIDIYQGGTFAAVSYTETDNESITYTMTGTARLDARVYLKDGIGVRGVSYTISRQ